MKSSYTFLLALFICVLLSSCGKGSDSDGKETGCSSYSDIPEFKCIQHSDFIGVDGAVTALTEQIAECTILHSKDNLCPLGTLNFLANESSPPTRTQILSRLIASHPWMADNFKRLLESVPDDMLYLFGSVTAIIIHSELRPAFFWPATGAIYLDPDYLWLTQEQLKTISTDADYRSDYGNALSYIGLSRYAKNGSYAYGNADGSRTTLQTLYLLSDLLFHELAHAADYFPATNITTLNHSLTPDQVASALNSPITSKALTATYGLTSQLMKNLARVLYWGDAATNDLTVLTATDVGDEFFSDGANDDYNYTSIEEDTAMLFEESMMWIHYGIDREVVFATQLADEIQSCDDLSFDWTGINRIGDSLVRSRAELAVSSLLPNSAYSSSDFISNATFTWCQPSPNPFHMAKSSEQRTAPPVTDYVDFKQPNWR